MTAIKSYQDLQVWQLSIGLVKAVYTITRQLPKLEQFGLASQINRSAVSIPSNIAEGHERHNLKEYIQFLGIARGSAAELETQLILVQQIYELDCSDTISQLIVIRKMLSSLVSKLIPKT